MKLSVFFILTSFIFVSNTSETKENNFNKLVLFKSKNNNNTYLFSTLNKNYYFSFTDENSGNLIENLNSTKISISYKIKNDSLIFLDNLSQYLNEKNKTFKNLDFIKEEILMNDSIKVSTLFILKNNKNKPKKNKVFEIYSFVNEKCYINEGFLNSYTHGYFSNTDFKTEIQLPFKIIHYDLYRKDIDTIKRIVYKKIEVKFNL